MKIKFNLTKDDNKIKRKMEVSLQIPRFEKSASEYVVFSQIEKFAELSQNLYRARNRRFSGSSPPVGVLLGLKTINKIPVVEIQELFQTLIDAAFAYRKPEHKPPKKAYEPMFTDSDICQWAIWKRGLKSTIELHKRQIDKLQKIQKQCWESRGKVQEYFTMVEAAQSAISNFSRGSKEYRDRCFALADLKRRLTDKQEKHLANVTQYDRAIEYEERIRDKIKEFAYNLKTGIISRVKARIEEGLDDLRSASYPTECRISSDPATISGRLYDSTCKHYKFQIPLTDTTFSGFNEPVVTPTIHDCVNNFQVTFQTYTATEGIFMAVKTTNHINSSTDMCTVKLRNGDKVKVLFLNGERSRGFGWVKHSALSFKTWGFFQTSDIVQKQLNKTSMLGGSQDLQLLVDQ